MQSVCEIQRERETLSNEYFGTNVFVCVLNLHALCFQKARPILVENYHVSITENVFGITADDPRTLALRSTKVRWNAEAATKCRR